MNKSFIVSVQKSSPIPLYRQIAGEIELQILRGDLGPGFRLPAIRTLSRELTVNTVTVVKAYDLLQDKALVHKIRGSGVYIGSGQKNPSVETEFNNDELYLDEEIELMHRGQIEIPPDTVNFATSTPTSDLFPVKYFKDALNKVLDRDGGAAFGYDESSGFYPLRRTFSQLLKNMYGITASPQQLQVISGAQQGIDITAKALIRPGDYVMVEDPTYTGALAVCKSRGANIIGIPMDKQGIDIIQLEKNLERYNPKLLYCMPDFQNPTSGRYSLERRKSVLDLARKYSLYVIEDDYVSDLRYSENLHRPSMKALDDPGNQRVIYIKSFSKLLMPGLRIGFLAAPEGLYRKILQAKHLSDIASSGILQRAFHVYLDSGAWEKHLAYMQDVYSERYRVFRRELKQLQELGVSMELPGGGLHFWLLLPHDIPASRLYREAASAGVLCTPGSIFRSGTPVYDYHIRLSTAAAHEREIPIGIKRLADTMKRIRGSHSLSRLSPMV